MTPQEQQLLTQLAQRINQTQLEEKDPDAENYLGRELGTNPDALYILAQTVLVQDMALQQAKVQVTQLQQQLQQAQQQRPQPAKSTSFLGKLLGEREPQPEPQQYQQQYAPAEQYQQPAPPYQPVQQQYQPAPPYGQQYAQPVPPPYAGQPQYVSGPGFVPAGPPSFLRGAMQTATGVAAGALAFEGVESLIHGVEGMGHPGFGGGGFGGGFGGAGFERPVEETVVNNYYGDDAREEHRDFSGGGEERLHDASYNNDRGWDNNLNDDSAAYDNSVDDVQLDDNSYDSGNDLL